MEIPPNIRICIPTHEEFDEAKTVIDYFYAKLFSEKPDRWHQLKKDASKKYLTEILFGTPLPHKIELAGKIKDPAASAEKIAGLIIGRIEKRNLLEPEEIVFIDTAVVLPEYQKLGCMHLLMQELFQICRERKIKVVELNVLKSNMDARDYWEKNGFTEIISRYRKIVG